MSEKVLLNYDCLKEGSLCQEETFKKKDRIIKTHSHSLSQLITPDLKSFLGNPHDSLEVVVSKFINKKNLPYGYERRRVFFFFSSQSLLWSSVIVVAGTWHTM